MALAGGAAEPKARNALLAAAGTSALGLIVAGTVSPVVGGVLLVAAWGGFLYALHSFGRAGED
ncbi:MAG TPA: hypothetical protein VGI39_37115 [Polyangiaceae bacterium]|jgi:hypothetical protein